MKLNEDSSSIRKKLKNVHPKFGDGPPRWTRDDIFGIADDDPAKIMSGLGLGNFVGDGRDWKADIYHLMLNATRSKILRNLYGEPKVNNNAISIVGSPIIYSYSPDGPKIMQKIIMSVLWAAEKTGKIAMPEGLQVKLGGYNRSVWIMW